MIILVAAVANKGFIPFNRILVQIPASEIDTISDPVMCEGDVIYTEILTQRLMDERVIDLFGDQLSDRAVGTSEDLPVVIDFEHVNEWSTSALGKLIRFRNYISGGKDKPSKVYLCNIQPQILEIFKVTPGLLSFFNIHNTKDGALKAAKERKIGSFL